MVLYHFNSVKEPKEINSDMNIIISEVIEAHESPENIYAFIML